MSQPSTTALPKASRAARAEAAVWITRLHGSQRSPDVEAGFRAWLAADPENARQFERVTQVWDSVGAVAGSGLPRVVRWLKPARNRFLMRAAAVLIVCVVVAFSGYWLSRDPSYSTGIGDQRIVRVEDGTRISLNSDSRVRIAYRDAERRVYLEKGEAYFEVARRVDRPFVVIAGDHRVTALGTSFLVRYEADRTAVTLVEGKVTVAPIEPRSSAAHPSVSAAAPADVRVLDPGERLVVSANRVVRVDMPRIEVVTAWRRGEVILDDTTLAEAVAEMNRYDAAALVIDDPAVAQLHVSGVYKTGANEGFAQAVARVYGLDINERDGRIHLQAGNEADARTVP